MFEKLRGLKEVQEIFSRIKQGERNIIAEPLSGCFAGMVYSLLAEELKESLLIITAPENAYGLFSEVKSLLKAAKSPLEPLYYPEDDSLVYSHIKPSKELSRERAVVYKKLCGPGRNIVITGMNTLGEMIPAPPYVAEGNFKVKKGDNLETARLFESLNANGYERRPKVYDVFEYSVRGSITDIFTPDYDYPVRIELNGDTVESVRFFSVETNESTKEADDVFLGLFNPQVKHPCPKGSIAGFFDAASALFIFDDFDRLK
ncbi:MAG TPA: hypothetical protein ENN43_07425, partial [bacterium]|nr:hypothetical protein [bacterium]